ncbi:hypothetical protein C8E00_10446 [Chromohalobacter marismortui]|uniref:Uncharacterized protein n=1 Tax=Chromohalobacter marismortui TaxID=42055 RepID=A0A4V3F3L2_9GAMM|nr:hypothetical protein C8E00_10446 [Chromohalobacter marismortui]
MMSRVLRDGHDRDPAQNLNTIHQRRQGALYHDFTYGCDAH